MAVPGEGPFRAHVVLVGEGPGRSEDLVGRPFVGRAGRLLDSSLESVGLSRRATFVTNVVKCRPPKNRVPKREEAETCVGNFLNPQLNLIQPRVVVLFGRTAARAVLDVENLREVRGKPTSKGGRTFLCTYHPAAVLRNPRLKRTFVVDLRKVRDILGHGATGKSRAHLSSRPQKGHGDGRI